MELTKEISTDYVKTPNEIREITSNRLNRLIEKYPDLEERFQLVFAEKGKGYWVFRGLKKGRTKIKLEHNLIIDEIIAKYNLTEPQP